jgi:uridylate kinase
MKTIVLSIGGSVVLSKEADSSFLKQLCNILKKQSNKVKLFIIIGGGSTARNYITLGRTLNFNEKLLDQIGIDITRINAKVFTHLFESSNKTIPKTTDDAINLKNNIIVMGGTTPGHSTDMVGAELAKKTNADLFMIATNVDGIYNKDPNKYNDATRYEKLHINTLIKNLGTSWESAGKNTVIDGPAIQIIKDASLKTIVLNGKQLNEIQNALEDKPFKGTEITF